MERCTVNCFVTLTCEWALFLNDTLETVRLLQLEWSYGAHALEALLSVFFCESSCNMMALQESLGVPLPWVGKEELRSHADIRQSKGDVDDSFGILCSACASWWATLQRLDSGGVVFMPTLKQPGSAQIHCGNAVSWPKVRTYFAALSAGHPISAKQWSSLTVANC